MTERRTLWLLALSVIVCVFLATSAVASAQPNVEGVVSHSIVALKQRVRVLETNQSQQSTTLANLTSRVSALEAAKSITAPTATVPATTTSTDPSPPPPSPIPGQGAVQQRAQDYLKAAGWSFDGNYWTHDPYPWEKYMFDAALNVQIAIDLKLFGYSISSDPQPHPLG